MNLQDKLYLRMVGGKVFGPVDLATIREWAGDGRVEPSAMVSNDRREWVRTADIPELEMEWVVENAPGQFYGPTHRAMVDELIKSGTLEPSARFYRDMRSALADRADAEAAMAAAEERLAEQARTLAEDANKLALAQDELAALKQRLTALEKENAQRISRADYERVEAERQRWASDHDARQRELATVREELASANKELASSREELEVANKELVSSRKELEAANKELESSREELAAIKREREQAAADVIVPEVMVDGTPPRVPNAFGQATGSDAAVQMPRGGFSRPGGAPPTSLADLERAAQAELARMRASGAKGFFFGRK